MNLSETVIYFHFKRMLLCRNAAVQTALPNAFSGEARFDMDISHIFPQGLLAALSFVGGGAGDGGGRVFIQHGLGHTPQLRLSQETQQPQEQSFLHPTSRGSQLLLSGVQTSHSPPVSPSGPSPANGAHLPHIGPQD